MGCNGFYKRETYTYFQGGYNSDHVGSFKNSFPITNGSYHHIIDHFHMLPSTASLTPTWWLYFPLDLSQNLESWQPPIRAYSSFPAKRQERERRWVMEGKHILEPCLDRCLQKHFCKWSAHYRGFGAAPGSNTCCKIWWMREEQQIGLMPGLQPVSEDQNVTRDHLTKMRCRNTLAFISRAHAWRCPHTQTEGVHTLSLSKKMKMGQKIM